MKRGAFTRRRLNMLAVLAGVMSLAHSGTALDVQTHRPVQIHSAPVAANVLEILEHLTPSVQQGAAVGAERRSPHIRKLSTSERIQYFLKALLELVVVVVIVIALYRASKKRSSSTKGDPFEALSVALEKTGRQEYATWMRETCAYESFTSAEQMFQVLGDAVLHIYSNLSPSDRAKCSRQLKGCEARVKERCPDFRLI